MFIVDTRIVSPVLSQEKDCILRVPISESRISSLLWGALDETIITGHENGELNIWDARVRQLVFFFHWGKKLFFYVF